MSDEESYPALRRRQLARQLKALRLESPYNTLVKAAERSGLSSATISRIETGKQVILPKNVAALARAYNLGDLETDRLIRLAKDSEDRTWLLEYAATVQDWFQRYVSEEADASEIWTYASECVHGLFQTDAYMRALMAAARPDPSRERSDTSVAFRRHRQERITGDRQAEVVAVMSEAAVRRLVGGVEVMREQLRHIIDLARRPNVEVQVLPFSAGAHPAMIHPFTMLSFPPEAGDPTIYVEVYGGALYPDRPEDSDLYMWKWSRLRSLALSPAKTVKFLTRLVDELNPGK